MIGIEATIDPIPRPWVPLIVSLRKGEYAIAFQGDSERLDPDDAYYMRFHSSEIGQNNWSRYSNKEMDRLLEQGRATWKWEERNADLQAGGGIEHGGSAILYTAKPSSRLLTGIMSKGTKQGWLPGFVITTAA